MMALRSNPFRMLLMDVRNPAPLFVTASVIVQALTAAFALGAVEGGPSDATIALLDANPGLVAQYDGDRLIAIYGVPFAIDDDPATDSDAFVDGWLFGSGEGDALVPGNVDALGVNDVDLTCADKIAIGDGLKSLYIYQQQIGGLPVYNSVVKLVVWHLEDGDKIGYAGVRLHQPSKLVAGGMDRGGR